MYLYIAKLKKFELKEEICGECEKGNVKIWRIYVVSGKRA